MRSRYGFYPVNKADSAGSLDTHDVVIFVAVLYFAVIKTRLQILYIYKRIFHRRNIKLFFQT